MPVINDAHGLSAQRSDEAGTFQRLASGIEGSRRPTDGDCR